MCRRYPYSFLGETRRRRRRRYSSGSKVNDILCVLIDQFFLLTILYTFLSCHVVINGSFYGILVLIQGSGVLILCPALEFLFLFFLN
jgi:hypothetical protein